MPHRSPNENEILVLLTGAFHGFGGIETFNRSLIHALDHIAAARSLRVRVLSLLDKDEQFSAMPLLSPGMQIDCFSAHRPKFAFSALRAARQAHLVLIGHVNFSPLARLMGSQQKCLFVYGIDVWKAMTTLQRLGVSRIQRILSISSFTAQSMRRFNPIESDRFTVVPLTLDPSYIDRANRLSLGRRELGLPAGPMLLTVSRLNASDAYKNIDRLIQALPPVFQRFPDAFSVMLGSGDDHNRLQRMSQDLGIGSKVFFPGRVPDHLLPAYYQNSDIFVLPSTKEGFGIVFLEAMYYGKPCVGANHGGVPEVVAHNHTGLLVDSPTPDNIQAALLQMLCDAQLMKTFGEQGRARFQQQFSFNRFRDRLERIVCPAAATETPQPLCAAPKLA